VDDFIFLTFEQEKIESACEDIGSATRPERQEECQERGVFGDSHLFI
jgi:hypothetical protein